MQHQAARCFTWAKRFFFFCAVFEYPVVASVINRNTVLALLGEKTFLYVGGGNREKSF